MSLQWNNPKILLPKRDHDIDENTSVNVLCYVDDVVVEGYYIYETEQWTVYNPETGDYTYGDGNEFDVELWAYFDMPKANIQPKIDGE